MNLTGSLSTSRIRDSCNLVFYRNEMNFIDIVIRRDIAVKYSMFQFPSSNVLFRRFVGSNRIVLLNERALQRRRFRG